MSLLITRAACIAAILCSPLIASSQHYYVVVGAFAADENAGEFKDVSAQVLDTSLNEAEKDNLLHFYVLKTSDKQSAIARTLKLKKEIEAWNASENNSSKASKVVPLPTGAQAGTTDAVATASNTREGTSASGAVSDAGGSAAKMPPPPVGKYFEFKVVAPDGGPIPAKVHHVDFDKGMELGTYKTNTFVDLLRPGQNDKPMAVVCGMFGYKEIQKYIDYNNPSATDDQAFVDSQGVWVIPYKLERVEEGDVSVMYNVSFYKEAVIMRPESETDLDKLVDMMHSNPYYEITIHAYCNGRNKREIIALGANKNYFDVAGSVKVDGSARDLTTLRAEAIRSYLVDHGIDPSRIEIYAWGGHDMLVKADSPYAYLNDRIEIEFTRD